MYSKLHCLIHFLIALALGAAALIAAHAQAPPAATVRGHISDQTGALIPGAVITVTTSAGTLPVTVTADAQGAYEVHGLAPGGYIVKATYAGFAPFQSPTIQLAAGQIKRVDISMAVEVEQQNVVVTDDSPTVNVEASGNSSAIVLKGKDLDALSDDPDELSSELSALAGPSAGPNGGQIYIDGFTGGQLPPKSAIREIRINQNPFSAEFDRLGYGRIEILTKPGTDKLHGQGFIQGNDSAFNTGNPFTPNVPPYYRVQYNGTVSGALGKKASFFASVEGRDNHDEQIYNYSPVQAGTCGLFGTYSASDGTCSGSENNPHNRTNLSPRLDLQLGQKNTLTVRYQYYKDSEQGDIQSTQLPSQSIVSNSSEHQVQISDAQIINDRVVNETRFQYVRDQSTESPTDNTPTIQVTGDFTGGGAASQQTNDHTDRYELQNMTTMALGRHALKFGTRLRDGHDVNSTDANFNGSFMFSETAYANALAALGKNSFVSGLPADAQPNQLSYTSGSPEVTSNLFDIALFVQDDWKFNPKLTLSGGLRWESQNHISDKSDWAPRVAFAYALDGHGGKPAKTVVRGGFGIFYDRFQLPDVLNAARFSANGGATQTQVLIANPTCFSAAPVVNLTSAELAACGAADTRAGTTVEIAPHFQAPYTEQAGASLERQLTKTTTLTFTYLHSFGVHQLVTRNANAPDPYTSDDARPNPSLGNINQYFPEAVFKQNQMIVNVNARVSPNFSVMGFYNLTAANSDGGAGNQVSNSYNLGQDYGRAGFVSRNMVFLLANYTGPWALHFNPFLIAQSGRPFNITTFQDLNGDGYFNDRPSYATSSTPADSLVHTSYGDFDVNPGLNEKPIPTNLGSGPAAVAVNLRISRSFGIGPEVGSTPNNAGGPPQGGGPPGGGRGGGPGGGGPGGGFGPGGFGGGGGGRGGPGGMFGGANNTGRKYSLTFSAQALNLFNDIDYGPPVGSLTPTPIAGSSTLGPGNRFGHSTGLQGGIFSSSAAARRIFFQAVFAF